MTSRKSTQVTSLDAGTPINPTVHHGRVRSAVAVVESDAADANNDVYRFVRVHSSWALRHIYLRWDQIANGTDFNIGLWDTAENGGAVVNENLFGDAVTLASAASKVPVDQLFENQDINKLGTQVWQMLGLTADPNRFYDVALIGIAIGDGGTIAMEVVYVAND
jgi:hypothetical protein